MKTKNKIKNEKTKKKESKKQKIEFTQRKEERY